MYSISLRLIVALLVFIVGVMITRVWSSSQHGRQTTGVILPVIQQSDYQGREIAQMNGSCQRGRPIEAFADYQVPLRAKDNKWGFINIRTDYTSSDEYGPELLGTIQSGTILWAAKYYQKKATMGIGYVVAVRDRTGNTCRGWVSKSVVDEIRANK